MEHEFWAERWSEGRIGFHQADGHPALRHLIQGLSSRRVLVPLAGKTVDVVTLHGQGHDVVAVEFVEQAVRAFAEEQPQLVLNAEPGPLGLELSGERMRFMAADFFEVSPALVGRFDLVFDRAALVALPPEMRIRYAAHLRTLLADDGEILTLTFEYDQSRLTPPPFSVPADELRILYPGATLTELDRRTVPGPPSAAASGLTFVETTHRISNAAQ